LPELSTGIGGCGDPGEVKLAWVVHEVREDAVMLLVRLVARDGLVATAASGGASGGGDGENRKERKTTATSTYL
jgi:hypothetical protein